MGNCSSKLTDEQKADMDHNRRLEADMRNGYEKEQDKIKLALGNNGYIVKNGTSVKVDMQKYNAPLAGTPVAGTPVAGPEPTSDRKVSVDVKIVE